MVSIIKSYFTDTLSTSISAQTTISVLLKLGDVIWLIFHGLPTAWPTKNISESSAFPPLLVLIFTLLSTWCLSCCATRISAALLGDLSPLHFPAGGNTSLSRTSPADQLHDPVAKSNWPGVLHPGVSLYGSVFNGSDNLSKTVKLQ